MHFKSSSLANQQLLVDSFWSTIKPISNQITKKISYYLSTKGSNMKLRTQVALSNILERSKAVVLGSFKHVMKTVAVATIIFGTLIIPMTTAFTQSLPLVSIEGGGAVSEGVQAEFTVKIDETDTKRIEPLVVSLSVSEGATNFISEFPATTVLIPSGESSATILVSTTNNKLADGNNGIIMAILEPGIGYELGTDTSASVSVHDNAGIPELSITGDYTINEGKNVEAVFTIHASAKPSTDSIAIDYTPTSKNYLANEVSAVKVENHSLTFSGSTTYAASLPILINNDELSEPDGQISVTLHPKDNYTVAASPKHKAVVQILDDDALPAITFKDFKPKNAFAGPAFGFADTGFSLFEEGVGAAEIGVIAGGVVAAAAVVTTAVVLSTGETSPSGSPGDNNPGDSTPDPIIPEVSIESTYSVQEDSGANDANGVVVTLSEASDQVITINYAFNEGVTNPATRTGGGLDYTATDGTLTLMPDEETGLTATTMFIPFSIIDDNIDEYNETFTITLTIPDDNATLTEIQQSITSTVTIDDNDEVIASIEPDPFSAPENSVANESRGDDGLAVTLSVVSTKEINVNYSFGASTDTATKGTDYTATEGTLTFLPDQNGLTVTSMLIPFTIIRDAIIDEDETFTITLTIPDDNATFTPNQDGSVPTSISSTITIKDVEPLPMLSFGSIGNLTPNTYDVAGTEHQDGARINFGLKSTKNTNTPLTVEYHLIESGGAFIGNFIDSNPNGNNEEGRNKTRDVTFSFDNEIGYYNLFRIPIVSTNSRCSTITMTLVKTKDYDLGSMNNKTVEVKLGGEGLGDFCDDPIPNASFGSATLNVSESSGDNRILVTLDAQTPQIVKVNYAFSSEGQTYQAEGDGIDYTAASGSTLTFTPLSTGITSANTSMAISFSINDDSIPEEDEKFTITLSVPDDGNVELGTHSTVTVTIEDDDPAPLDPQASEITTTQPIRGFSQSDASIESANAPAINLPKILVVAEAQSVDEGDPVLFNVSGNDDLRNEMFVQYMFVPEGDFFSNLKPDVKTVVLSATRKVVRIGISTIDDNLAEQDGALTLSLLDGNSYILSEQNSTRVVISDLADRQRRIAEITTATQDILPEMTGQIASNTLGIASERIDQAYSVSGGLSTFSYDGNEDPTSILTASGEAINTDSMTIREVLGSSSFAISLYPESQGTNLATIWGIGDYSNTTSKDRTNTRSWDSDVFTGHLGIDTKIGQGLLVGISAAVTESDIEHSGSTEAELMFKSRSTTLNPYFGWDSSNTQLRAIIGYGAGEIDIDQTNYELQTVSNSYQTIGVTANNRIYSSDRILVGGKSELSLTGLSWYGRQNIIGVEGLINSMQIDASHYRIGLNGSHTHNLVNNSTLNPTISVGLHGDGIDDLSTIGIEIGSGINFTAPVGLSIISNSNIFMVEQGEIENWTLSGTLNFDHGNDQLGTIIEISPSYGQKQGTNSHSLWSNDIHESAIGTNQYMNGAKLESMLGFGMEIIDGTSRLKPFGSISFSEESGNNYDLGTEINIGSHMKFNLIGTQTIDSTRDDSHKVNLIGTYNW